MKLQNKRVFKRILSFCITFSLLFSLLNLSGITACATENGYEKTTLSLNSDEMKLSTIDAYLCDSTYYITTEDLCSLSRCSQTTNGDTISINQGFWWTTFDVEKQQFDDGYQTVDIKILEVEKNQYAVPALMFLSYFNAAAFIESDTLYCRMPETTAWEALNVDFGNSLVDIYELYGGEGNVTLSLTLDILMDFIMGNMSTSDDYLTDAFLAASKVNLYDYSSVQDYKAESQNKLYNDLHSDVGVEFVEALDDVLSLAEEPTEWYIQYYYNAIEKSFVSLAYDAYEAGQHADVTHYGAKFYDAFAEKNKVSDKAGTYFENADYLMLFVSAAVETAQEMKYASATDNLVYNVMGKENLNYLGISADDNDWFTVADRYKNVLGVAATNLEAEAMQYFTDTLCWETLIGTGVSSAAGISGGAWSFSLNFARFFVENFPLTSSSIEAFEADRRALYLSEMQQNVYWVAMNTLKDMQGQWDNPEIYSKYIQSLQLYCRTSIAMYENLITMVDEFGNNREYWTNLFQARIDMLAVSLYQLTTLQDDGVNSCLPLDLDSFTNDTDNLVTVAYEESVTYQANIYNYDTGKSEEKAVTNSYLIPEINLSGAEVERINKEIYDTLYPLIQDSCNEVAEYGLPFTSDGISYAWAVNGDVLSLVVINSSNPEMSGGNVYMVYNISISSCKTVSDSMVVEAAGYSNDEYKIRAQQVLGSKFWSNWERDNENFKNENFVEFFNEQLKKTISTNNIEQAYPYIDGDGHLHIIAKLYSLAAADYYWHDLDMVEFELLDYSEVSTSSNPASSLSDAYKATLQTHSDATEYALYDIDKDGTPELIIYTGWEYVIYTATDLTPTVCGKCYAYYRGFYVADGNGIVVHEGGIGSMRLEYVNLYILSKGKFEQSDNIINTEEYSMDDLYALLENYTKIEFYSVSDLSVLSNL